MKCPMPQTPADCLEDIPLDGLHRDLVIARIEYLLVQRIHEAVLKAIEESFETAKRTVERVMERPHDEHMV